MVRTVRKVPDEWEKFEAIGQVIENTRIFAFKTPLKLELRNRVKKLCLFTTQHFFRNMILSGKTIGLVINVCNTERYYDRADIEGMMVDYKWIACPGRNFLVRGELVKTFCKTVDEFLATNHDNDYLIGVNCSNGVNRSGYLICRYLIDRLGWSSHDALNAFEIARGYPIERGSFVSALHKADRERRLKSRNDANVDGDDEKTEKKRKRKRKSDSEDISGIDPILTAQMMQQFYQMEQQFKQAAENAASPAGLIASPYEGGTSLGGNGLVAGASSQHSTHSPATSFVGMGVTPTNGNNSGAAYTPATTASHHLQQNFSSQPTNSSTASLDQVYENQTAISTSINDADTINDDDNSRDQNVDFESMGKVELREVSNSESRRNRRKRLDKQFQVMKRGKFWEINEMRKDMGI